MTAQGGHGIDRRLFGVCPGLIEDNVDPEKEGRVKVRFPWLDDATVSEWCRVCQPYAGNGYGSIFVPEIGDEVLIAFVHGDMSEPVVLGGMYNGQDKPPFARTQSEDVKAIVTKGKHKIVFDDTPSAAKVELTSAGGHTVELDDQQKKLTIKSAGGHELVLDDQGRSVKLSSSAGSKIEIDAAGKITLQGTTITLSASNINIGG